MAQSASAASRISSAAYDLRKRIGDDPTAMRVFNRELRDGIRAAWLDGEVVAAGFWESARAKIDPTEPFSVIVERNGAEVPGVFTVGEPRATPIEVTFAEGTWSLLRGVLSSFWRRRQDTPAAKRERPGARLLKPAALKRAQQFYRDKLDSGEEPHVWLTQRAAAERITTHILKLDPGSWQTVEDQVVKPVLQEFQSKQK
jgi:hypothetical protein